MIYETQNLKEACAMQKAGEKLLAIRGGYPKTYVFDVQESVKEGDVVQVEDQQEEVEVVGKVEEVAEEEAPKQKRKYTRRK